VTRRYFSVSYGVRPDHGLDCTARVVEAPSPVARGKARLTSLVPQALTIDIGPITRAAIGPA
jgi:hypothetical protein